MNDEMLGLIYDLHCSPQEVSSDIREGYISVFYILMTPFNDIDESVGEEICRC